MSSSSYALPQKEVPHSRRPIVQVQLTAKSLGSFGLAKFRFKPPATSSDKYRSTYTGNRTSACLRMAMIWLSVKRDVFMQNFQNLSLENSTFKRDHLLGGLPMVRHIQVMNIRTFPKSLQA
jgi:hypothetical protein